MTESRKEKNLKFANGKYYLDFTFKGKRIRRFGGYTKEQARVALAKERLDRRDVALGLKKPAVEEVDFGKFADKYLDLYSKVNKRSWRSDETSLAHLKEFFKGEALLSLTAEMVENYKVGRKAEVSPATVNREIACLKTLFSKAVEWGRLETSPAARVKKLKEPPARERIMDVAETRRLVEAAGPEVRPVIIIALNTGMRRNEILSLHWRDLDLRRGVITIEDSKSGKSRKVPMNEAVHEVLRGLPRTEGVEFVFYNPETGTHVKDIKTGFKAACARAKIVGLRLHDLRHTAASKMVEAGVDLVTVSKILGHASIQMTMRYAHPTPENMRSAVLRLGEILDSTRQKADTPSVAVPAVAPLTYSKHDH